MQDQLGHTTELKEEEEIILEQLMMIRGLGFPLSSKDLCFLIKSYLDGQGRKTRNMSGLTLPLISCCFFKFKILFFILYAGKCLYHYRFWHWEVLIFDVPKISG
jgi:hypothetical protein